MPQLEGCKHELEISVPAGEVESETERVVSTFQKRARLPGFRPGKAPPGLIRKQFESDIRQQVLENLVPKYFNQQVENENLRVVGQPNIVDVRFEPGEPLRFKAEFEVFPQIELQDYSDLTVPYHDPEITDEDVTQRIEALREQKAEYVNVDPRPVAEGDHAVVALESIGGVEGPPIHQDEMMLHIGDADTLPEFTEHLLGASPGDQREFAVAYPADYGQPRLAGKSVRFKATVKGIRRKELPDVNDEFAKDLGDFRDLGELREALRKSIFAERQYGAQQDAKNKLVEALVERHSFTVPEVFIERQIRSRLEQRLQALAAQGVDPGALQIDWQKLRVSQRDAAEREVKASLLLSRIADREGIDATREEVDKEIERLARQRREPFAALRLKLEKDGSLGRIASQIQTDKVLSFLFEHARKVVEEEKPG